MSSYVAHGRSIKQQYIAIYCNIFLFIARPTAKAIIIGGKIKFQWVAAKIKIKFRPSKI
jgi:hypothetical protein